MSEKNKTRGDFSSGKVSSNIIAQAVPLMLAQLVQLMYNVVDRIYIGHMPGIGSMALTGIGLAFPLTTLIAAFTALFGIGGAPLFSIARGEKNDDKAEKILTHVMVMLIASSLILFAICYGARKPILYLFGASDASYPYANAYLKIYLFGTCFTMFSTGLNNFINAQGYPRLGMMTTIIGAALNLILDPIFIFALNMGIEGAAIATVLSQAVSAGWVLLFFLGKKTMYHFRKEYAKLEWPIVKEILALGVSGFIAKGTNCAVQVVCNSTLRMFGGDMYVGIMTCINSVREIAELPIFSLTSGAQPVLSYNYGAKKYARLKKAIRFSIASSTIYTILFWIVVMIIPDLLISIFTNDPAMISEGVHALKLYFIGFFFMAFQAGGQSIFTALKYSKHAVFFSLFRKVIIVIPLSLLLPRIGLGVNGVYLAEPVSNLIGGLAAFTTMIFTVYKKLPEKDE